MSTPELDELLEGVPLDDELVVVFDEDAAPEVALVDEVLVVVDVALLAVLLVDEVPLTEVAVVDEPLAPPVPPADVECPPRV